MEEEKKEPILLEDKRKMHAVNRWLDLKRRGKGLSDELGGWKWVFLGWAVIIVLFLIALSFIPIGKEPLTELYFNNHLNLPKQAGLYKSYNASFTINNLEYKWMDYHYVIREVYSNTTRILVNSSVQLDDNSSASIPFDFSFNEHFGRAMVQVTLVDLNQSIHLWVDEKV